ncbi:hypothetical protein EBL87_08950 [Cereibacter sphaeroides]|uniref:hypothetical protein n=1 Tax=Cereibacter sphaeroides TaxID=1063 RepID=UPI000F52FADE|nr:hypothetical protein [Cereibacter sphaeroides]AZB63857.1 hypothetical protein EBL87_08950 [Cereibacter sphaeroides]AZB68221.1 hypothetical protein EBL86_07520 [Cereibacter sphaeroides]
MQVVSRKEAQAAGATHFFTGRPCRHGHVALRYTSNKRCVKCAYEGYGEGRWRHREQARTRGDQFYSGRPCPQGHTKRYASSGVCVECAKDRGLARSRAIRRSRPAWFSGHDAAAISRMRRIAEVMTEATGEPWEPDHILPLGGRNVCGLHVAANIQAMPRRLNRRKSNRIDEMEVAYGCA